MQKKIFITALFLIISSLSLFAYGPTGHRTVAVVAEKHLSCSAKRAIKKILGNTNLVLASTYADDIKSDKKYNYAYTWHFVNMKQGETYAESKKNPKGDLITAFYDCVKTLKNKNATLEEKRFALRFLVHLVGEAHQPLHVGRPEDRGGNDIKVKWFGEDSNLHRVWDDEMLDFYKRSYSELAENMPRLARKVRKQWQQGDIMTWIEEIQPITDRVYLSAKPNENLRYEYMYKNFDTLKLELHKAGIRLAGILNAIF